MTVQSVINGISDVQTAADAVLAVIDGLDPAAELETGAAEAVTNELANLAKAGLGA